MGKKNKKVLKKKKNVNLATGMFCGTLSFLLLPKWQALASYSQISKSDLVRITKFIPENFLERLISTTSSPQSSEIISVISNLHKRGGCGGAFALENRPESAKL